MFFWNVTKIMGFSFLILVDWRGKSSLTTDWFDKSISFF